MATTRPFAYNTGSTISETEQVGDIAVGVGQVRYDEDWGGVKWWNGPDEELGYVIAQSVPSGDQPNPLGISAYIGFFRSTFLTEVSFVELTNQLFNQSFTTGNECKVYLNNNGYWTSWITVVTPTPTPTITPTPTPTSLINGSALFSGSNFLTVNGNTGTAMETVDFTWECWVYPTYSLEYQAFLDSRENPLSGGDTTGYYFGTNLNTLTPIVYTNGIVLEATGDITLNEWNHVALTRSNGTINIWINGINRGSTVNATNLTTQRIFIGGDEISNGLNLTGNLSNIRITKGVAVYTENFTIPTTNFTVTQSANINGNPSAAITEGQTQLLLNTNFGDGFLTDVSTNNFTVINNNGVTSSTYEPFTPTPTPTPTNTPTVTPTITPTITPTPTMSPILVISAFTAVGSTTWTAPAGVTSVEYLVVGGGGGAGNGYDNAGGGGGGAGMVLSGTTSVTPGNTYTVTVGDGGVGGANERANNAGLTGNNSVFDSITALGGGNGLGSRTGGVAGVAQVSNTTSATGGSGSGGGFGGKGGGGSTGNGSNNSGTTGGAGGSGTSSSITGSAVIYGVGGSGANAGTQNPGVNGTSNTGNGGRAGGATSANSTGGGNGGSGVVVLKYYA